MLKKLVLIPMNIVIIVWGIGAYILTSRTPSRVYGAMISLFCKTRGKSNDLMHWVVTKIRKPCRINYPITGILGTYNKSEIKQIAAEINEYGYHIFKHKLPDKIVDKLLNFAIETEAYIRPLVSEDDLGKGFKQRTAEKIDRSNPKAIRYEFDTSQIIQNKDVQDILADEVLLALAQEYLQCMPVLDVLGMWWHTDFSKEPNSEAATIYHFDMDRIKWLKIFFYLTDVTTDNGPHQFISGSHKSGNIPDEFLKRGYARLDDKDVLGYYGKDREVIYVAPRGTIIIEDTRGLHKGAPVQEGNRLMFQMQFSDCLFGSNYAKTKFNETIDKLSQMIDKYPKVYQQYV